MRTWNLAAGDPLSLTLAADARLTATDYTDDQIWELSLGGGEPAALALQTTYGLRAHWMRLFPRFVRGETAITDPASFHTPPRITRLYPNYLALTYAPFEGLEVEAEYWIVESHLASGRIKLSNHNILPLNFRLEWVALLNPIDRQGGMAPIQSGPTHALAGETAYLYPVVFLTGGPQPVASPFPALTHEIELYPGSERQFTWAAAALSSADASLEAAHAATARRWEAELARVEMINGSQQIEVQTGRADWDAAFAMTQNTAIELMFKNELYLPHPSYVLSRRPDQGFSVRGDGSDHPYLWSGQTALSSYYLTSLLLPGAPDLAAGLLRNALAVQDENGVIDWKPGLGGQRGRRLAQPLLAAQAVQLAPYLAQLDWYREVFPGLLRFFNTWFSSAYDQDGDGYPEWEHPMQTGIEDSPIFDRWSPSGDGIDTARLEAPALAAMLLRECTSLIEMARALEESEKVEAAYARLSGDTARLSGASEALPELCEREAHLRDLLAESWDAQAHIYRYRDYQTHLSPPGQLLVEFNGTSRAVTRVSVPARKRFTQSQRLIVHLKVSEERTYAVTFTISGFTAEGETSEVIAPRSFSWLGRQARATTQNAWLAVKKIEVSGLNEDDEAQVTVADYTQEDCSLFLPLWAGAPDEEQARLLVEHTLPERYLEPFGIPLCPPDIHPQEELPGLHTAVSSALLPWNHLIGEGLLRYGYRSQAADLVTRLMEAVTGSLKAHQAFREYYQAESGAAAGERGHLHGLAPLGLFLQTAGIRALTPKLILLDGFNPFPWTIHVQYRKVGLTLFADKTEIKFSGGQTITIDQPGPHQVSLE